MTSSNKRPSVKRRAMTDLTTPPETALPTSRRASKARSPKSVMKGRGESARGREKVSVVEIWWVDAVAVAPEQWEDETGVSLAPAPSLAVGYVIGETAESITVVSLVNESHYAHGITIPKGCVTKVVTLG